MAGWYRILAFDGGGVRGWLTARLVDRLDAAVPGWWSRADLLAGTSTGSLLALGLAAGHSPRDLMALYEQHASAIFRDSVLDNLADLGNWVGAQYSDKPLRNVLREVFGDLRLRDLPRRVLIPAFDLDNEHPDPSRRSWAPKFFHNFPGWDSDGDRFVRDVALYSCAAPTYFPSADGFIDGGVVANNPSMAALAQTQDPRNGEPNPPLDRVVLLSLGTGQPLWRIEGARHDWGRAQWLGPLIDLMFDGLMGVADYQCRQLLGPRYHRLSPRLPPNRIIRMDDWKRLAELRQLAEQVKLKETVQWLRDMWSRTRRTRLLKPKPAPSRARGPTRSRSQSNRPSDTA